MPFMNKLVRHVVACVFAAGVMVTASSASAAVLYDFSLDANGDVGPIRILVRLDDFIDAESFIVRDTTEVEEFSASPSIDESSVVGLDVIQTATRVGISAFLPGLDDFVLLTRDYPADFFVFDRTPTQTGTFLSTSGLVESSLDLDDRSPVATLTVTEVVPEPATVVLLGLAGIGAVARGRRR